MNLLIYRGHNSRPYIVRNVYKEPDTGFFSSLANDISRAEEICVRKLTNSRKVADIRFDGCVFLGNRKSSVGIVSRKHEVSFSKPMVIQEVILANKILISQLGIREIIGVIGLYGDFV